MSTLKFPPLRYDYTGALVDPAVPATIGHCLTPAMLTVLLPSLLEARRQMLEDDPRDFAAHAAGGALRPAKAPLDAAFFDLPERLLREYQQSRAGSELHRLLETAKRLREEVDQVVVLGIGGSYMGAKALMDACCDPYFNELSRADRGSRPRLYFEGNNFDNDAAQGLLKLLGKEPWGLIVISKSGGTLETAAATRVFLRAFEQQPGDAAARLRRLIPVTGQTKDSKLLALSRALGVPDAQIFAVPEGVGGRFSIFSAVGLLPASVVGINVVQLLEGAAQMNDIFRHAPPGQNPVLDYVAVGHLLETRLGVNIRVLSAWAKALECAGLWYDQLLAESLGKEELGATPLTTVNTRDLHSRQQQHQQGRRDKLVTNVVVDNWRCDALTIGASPNDQDNLNRFAAKTLPELMAAAIAGTNEALRQDGRPYADLRLPLANEAALGQFFQMLMLATVLEGRLLGINPYGQPGVEFYKTNMQARLTK